MLVPVDDMQSRPPIKRQRLSDPTVDERFPATQGSSNGQSSLPMRLSGPGAHAYPVNDKAILGIGIEGGVVQQEEERVSSSSSSSRRTSSGSTSKSVKSYSQREERSVDRDAGKKKSTSRPQTPRDTEPVRQTKPPLPPPPPPPPPPPTKEQPVPKEQDAHEWLLEHYAGNTSSPAPPMARMRGGRPPSASGPSERHHSRTPAPEITIALEQELEDAAGPPSVHKPDTDPDVALELVAESIDAEDGIKIDRVSMEVDDELLSLVDDPTPVPLPPAPPAQIQRYPFAAPPPSLRLSKPLTPTIVTVASPAFASPTPVSPFPPTTTTSERGSMPPPATTHITGKGVAAKKAESSTTAKGKKAAKVRTPPSFA